jgi:hypothetical protein
LLRQHNLQLILQLVGGMNEGMSALRWYERLEVSGQDISHPRFMRWLRQIVTWDFALAPLVANEFNEAKSAIKFLEYAALGVPGIFSDVGEYSSTIEHGETGLLVASDRVQDWEQAIFELASNAPLRERLATNARRELLNKHLLGDAVPIWLSVIGENRGENYADLVPRSQRGFVSR